MLISPLNAVLSLDTAPALRTIIMASLSNPKEGLPLQTSLFFAFEIIGTVAFACSGAMLAIQKNLDLLGIVVLAVTTACGGGMIRDLLLGSVPPALFIHPVYVILATVSALALFLCVRFLHESRNVLGSAWYDGALSLMDAVGLGAFTVVGIDTALASGYAQYRFFVVFLGVITGVGGGILRDIMASETPAVLKKHIYACASILGAIMYVYTLHFSRDGAMIMSFLLVVGIRMLARHYRWNLPHVSP